nr:response regulator [Ardenticatena sp.]
MSARVLVLEDNQELLGLYQKMLTSIGGYDVEAVSTIYDATRALQTRHFDFFICDLNLVEENSFEFLRRWVSSLRHEGTHVLVVSAESQYMPMVQELGIEFFLVKPVDMQALIDLLGRLKHQPL